MNYSANVVLISVLFFAGILLFQEIGRQLALRQAAKHPDRETSGAGIVEGAIFALFGLLIAFTFSGAASRFDTRRQWIVDESNAIGTAYLRLDLLPAPARDDLRAKFRTYLDRRLEAYQSLPDLDAAHKKLAECTDLQNQIWAESVAACAHADAAANVRVVLLPSLNAMFDITTTRTAASFVHPPKIIFALLYALGLACALMSGFEMAKATGRNWLVNLGFAVVMAATTFVILDMEYPRAGFIRVDDMDRVLIQLRQSMN